MCRLDSSAASTNWIVRRPSRACGKSQPFTPRSAVSDFRVQSRIAQGVKLVRLSEGAQLVSVSVCEAEEEENNGGTETDAAASTEAQPPQNPTSDAQPES